MLQPGKTLDNGKYRVEAVVGRGGFGHVYRAREQLTGETVAIKELVPGLGADPQMVQRFLQEARATLRLTHPNIARTYNIFRDGDTYYLAMEYLPGGSLTDRLRRGPLPLAEAMRIMEDLCAALGYAHEQGVVHCDIKPANVLFDAQGAAHLADFGVAHVSEQMMTRQVYTATGATMGTVRYMAPEQLEGVRDDARVDIYALGTLLYEMLSGRPYLDFETESTPAAQMRNLHRIQNEQPRPLRASNPAVPEWLETIVQRALAKQPEKRFATSGELARALARRGGAPGVEGQPTGAPAGPVRPGRPAQRALSTRRWLLVGGAALLLLLLICAVVALVGNLVGDKPTPSPAATQIIANATGSPTPSPSPAATDTPPEPTDTAIPPTPTTTPSPTPVQVVGPYIGQVVTVRIPVADIWLKPRVGSGQERETQVLMGEQIMILEIRENWYQVVALAQPSSKDHRGYPGWIQSGEISLAPYEADEILIVMQPSAYLYQEPTSQSGVVAEISLDTRLKVVAEQGDWVQAELPGGDRAWVERIRVRVERTGQSSYQASPEDLIATARSLLGVQYLWGGSSWRALDCSGVMYRTFHAHGILLARDSRDQAAGGSIVAQENLQPGDLVFYAVGGPSGTVSHVGLYLGDGLIIATQGGQNVGISRYDNPAYEKEYWGARRYW
jgi:hypothetical protein